MVRSKFVISQVVVCGLLQSGVISHYIRRIISLKNSTNHNYRSFFGGQVLLLLRNQQIHMSSRGSKRGICPLGIVDKTY